MAADQMPADRHRKPPVEAELGPQVVGRRVVVRRVLRGQTGPSGGPALADVLGTCESWADGLVRVRREDGTVVEIATTDIVAGKAIPPRPPRRRPRG